MASNVNEKALPVTDQIPTDQQSPDASQSNKPNEYAKSYPRVTKDNLYMIIALWMEDFVGEAPKNCNKVGAVLVLPNDVVCAADCSRGGVHAVARLLMNHYDKAEGSKMFMSRKPCPMCAKLLVQSKVQRVLFLPLEPEYYCWPEPLGPETDAKTREEINKLNAKINDSNKTQMKQVDILFTASAIAQTTFVLQVDKTVLERTKKKTPTKDEKAVQEKKCRLIEQYSALKKDSKWMKPGIKEKLPCKACNSIKEELPCVKEYLPWPIFDDNIAAQVEEYFQEVMEWIARVLVMPQSQSKPEAARGLNYDFELCEHSKGKAQSDVFDPVNNPTHVNKAQSDVFDPVKNPTHVKQAKRLVEIARFLATRTDDPNTGVGAVIVSQEMEILSLGWNGFPLKAHYGEFARASDKDESDDKKYPYVIHAEQNALLMRNEKNIKGAILFVTRSPCNECTPLIAMQGIKTVVVDEDVSSRDDTAQKDALSYEMFPDMVRKEKFICYQTKKKPIDAKDIPASDETTQNLMDM